MNHREQFEKEKIDTIEAGHCNECDDGNYVKYLEKALDDKTAEVEEYKQKSLDTVHSHKEMQEYLTQKLNDNTAECEMLRKHLSLAHVDIIKTELKSESQKYRDALEIIADAQVVFTDKHAWQTCKQIAQQALSTEETEGGAHGKN